MTDSSLNVNMSMMIYIPIKSNHKLLKTVIFLYKKNKTGK